MSMRDSVTVTCKYSSCLHESREINKENAVKKGSSYYHKDCLQTQEEIKEIINLFKNHINPNPVYSQLQSVIKNIVFTKGLGSNFLLFGLRYYIENKIPLNYPQGLYYVVQNKDVVKAYQKKMADKAMSEFRQNQEIPENVTTPFGYVNKRKQTITDIIGGWLAWH